MCISFRGRAPIASTSKFGEIPDGFYICTHCIPPPLVFPFLYFSGLCPPHPLCSLPPACQKFFTSLSPNRGFNQEPLLKPPTPTLQAHP